MIFCWLCRFQEFHPPYMLELVLALYYVLFAGLSGWMRDWILTGYCCIMTFCFLAVSFGDYWM